MSHFIAGFLMSLGLGMGLGVGSIMGIRNGTNNSPIHTLVTLVGCNVIDVTMMVLYYIGASVIFSYKPVQVILYIVGTILLTKIAYKNVKNAHKALELGGGDKQSLFKSLLDGVGAALLPSSAIWWVSTVGTVLVNRTSHLPSFLLACVGILAGFMFCNLVYFAIVVLIDKLSSNKIIYWLNILSGCILLYIAFTFVKQLLVLL